MGGTERCAARGFLDTRLHHAARLRLVARPAPRASRGEEGVVLDQPRGVVAGDELADRMGDLVDGLEDATVDDLLFRRPEQPLDGAVGFGLGDEGVARRP
jgi:hypothetical protein